MIKKIDNIILFGTSHVAKDEVSKILKVIEDYNPEVVCLELDSQRLKKVLMDEDEEALINKKKVSSYKMIKELGTFGYLFALVAGYVQKKVGKSININPGIDMKTAYLKARELKIPISLIDVDIKVTLKKMSNLGFFKKISLVSSLFFKSFNKKYRKLLNFDLSNLPQEEQILKMIKILEKETPDLYKILIKDRNEYMSNRLLRLRENHSGNIIAFVGAGHLDGMIKYLNKKIKKSSYQNIDFSFKLDDNLEINENFNLDI